MSATAHPAPAPRGAGPRRAVTWPRRTGPLQGLGPSLRLLVRRLRVQVLAWALPLWLLLAVTPPAYEDVYPSLQEREPLVESMRDTAGTRLLYGALPLPGRIGQLVQWETGTYLLICVGLMATLLTCRAMRADEDDGLVEVQRGSGAGHLVPFMAPVLVVWGAVALVAGGAGLVLTGLTRIVSELTVSGAWALAGAVAATGWAFAALAAVSLAWLMTSAPADGSVYFDTRARIWEFALGSAVAAAAPALRPRSAWIRWLVSWLGLGTLLLFCLVSIGTYPGPMAAVPMAAVAAILLCGTEPRIGTVSRLLSWRPLVALGDRSYAVYLLHWPLFVLYLTATQQQTFDLQTGAVLILASLVAAAAMTRCVDRPAQVFPRSGRRLGVQAAMVTVSLVVGGIPLGVAGGAIAYQRHVEISQQVQAGVDPDHPGALAVLNGQASDWTKPPVPGPLSVTTEWATLAGVKCADDLAARIDSENSSCRRLPAVSDTALKAVVVGDSHAAQNVIPTMRLLHETDDWDITAYLKGGCSFGLPEYYKDSCRERNNVVLEQLERNPPDVVVLQTTETSKDSSIELLRPGIKKIVEQLTEEGITVIGFRDNPRSEKSLYECANAVGPQTLVGGCVFPKENAMAAEDPAKFLEENPLFHQIDASDMLCPDGVCGTIIGDVFVYMDDNHISSTYSRTMAPELAARIEAAMDPADSGRE